MVSPPPGVSSGSSVPLIASVRPRDNARPSPTPVVSVSPSRWKGANIRSRRLVDAWAVRDAGQHSVARGGQVIDHLDAETVLLQRHHRCGQCLIIRQRGKPVRCVRCGHNSSSSKRTLLQAKRVIAWLGAEARQAPLEPRSRLHCQRKRLFLLFE